LKTETNLVYLIVQKVHFRYLKLDRMKGLVIGATGATGKDLVQQLLQDKDFEEINVFVRKSLNFNNPKLKTHLIDFDKPEEWKDLVRGDVAFSCLGTTLKAAGSKEAQYKIDVDYQYNFAKMAKENGVQDFVLVSSHGADENSGLFYPRMKGELEEKIKNLSFEKLTFFQPGLLDREDSERTAEVIGIKLLKFVNQLGFFKHQKPLPTSILAKAMINASKIKSNGFSEIKLGNIFSFAKKHD
jgi:uncharacterized protein YbjT (DUF2867 family)